MPPHITVVIIDSDISSKNIIENKIKLYPDNIKYLGYAKDLSDGLPLIRKTNPMVVIIEIKDLNKGVSDINNIISQFPRISIFATSSDKTFDSIMKIMRAGAAEYLLRPVNELEIENAFNKIGRFWTTETVEEAKKFEKKDEGTVISVYGPIGGVGVTTISVNLAASFAAKGSNVALVDLNFYSDDVSSFLDIAPKYTLSTVTSNISRLDSSFLKGVITKHSSGINVLVAPQEVDEALSVTSEEIRTIIPILKKMFSYVIIDTGGHLDNRNLAIFGDSDKIFLVFVASFPSIKNTKRYLLALDKKGFKKDRVKLLINRYLPKGEIKIENAEKALNYNILSAISNDYKSVVGSINKGKPLINIYPNSPVSEEISELADKIRKHFGPNEEYKSL